MGYVKRSTTSRHPHPPPPYIPSLPQVQGSPGRPVLYNGPLHAFATIARSEGLGAFYRGLFTTYLKTAPSMGAVYFFYDVMSRGMGVGGLNRYRG